MSAISQRVLQLIDLLEVKRKPFADRIGITVQTISGWIHRDSDPNFETIQAILTAYPGINARWLILGEGKPLLQSNEAYVSEPVETYQTAIDREQFNLFMIVESLADLKVRVKALEKRLNRVEKKE